MLSNAIDWFRRTWPELCIVALALVGWPLFIIRLWELFT